MANASTPARKSGKERLKGLVLAGGKGSRLRPLTATGAKQLVPVANRPIVFYALEQMVAAGITDIGIITGDTASQVEQALGDGSSFGARFTYIHQDAPLGLAHAVKTARAYLADDPFCMYLGDNFLKQGIVPHAEHFRANGANAHILLTHVEDPSSVGVAILDDTGHIARLIEKPATPVSNLAVIGIYFFSPEIHDIIERLSPSARGELEITDAIQGMVEAGYVVDAAVVDDTWVDTGKKDDMLEANRIVLGAISRKIDGDVDHTSTVTGEVAVAAGARIINSVVRGPAVIGAGALIENAFVGPFTSIGEQCEIVDCEIEHSIVMNNSIIRNMSLRISDSLIGKEVIVERRQELPHTVKLLLGDNAQGGVDLMRVLVTGAGGQLGSYLRPRLVAAGHDVAGLGHHGGPAVEFVADLADLDAVAEAIATSRPDIIVHAAAWTDVDGCERDPARADAANRLGSANLASIAAENGIWMLGIGTDFVFDGEGGAPYVEEDPPHPRSVYGSSKLAGERAILDADPSFAVARTAWLYGGVGKHFPRTVLNVLEQRGGMEVVDDETGSPTFAGDLADAIVALLPHRPPGILHLVNEGSTSRFGLARAVAAAAGRDPDAITPIATTDFLAKYPLPAHRPLNSTLSNVRAAALGVRLPSWDDAIDRYVPRLATEMAGS